MGELRIIAGLYKGRRIAVPKGEVRPTSERVREAVFGVLEAEQRIIGSRVLDLFAGSGALGLEALSRGAAHCTFVEADHRVAEVLRGNIERLDAFDRSRVFSMRYERALGFLGTSPPGYDVLFIDPPYRMLDSIAGRVGAALRRTLKANGIAVIEGPRHVEVDLGIKVTFRRRYGDTCVTMVERGAEHP